VCPETGAPLATRNDMIACIDDTADQIVDELLCWQFPANGGADWPCPLADGSPARPSWTSKISATAQIFY